MHGTLSIPSAYQSRYHRRNSTESLYISLSIPLSSCIHSWDDAVESFSATHDLSPQLLLQDWPPAR